MLAVCTLHKNVGLLLYRLQDDNFYSNGIRLDPPMLDFDEQYVKSLCSTYFSIPMDCVEIRW